MEPVCIFLVTRFAFLAFRALDLDFLREALLRRLDDLRLERRRGARGLLAVRLFLDRERLREVEALRFGARGAAALRRFLDRERL